MTAADGALAVLVASMAGVLLAGVVAGARRASLTPDAVLRLGSVLAAALGSWLAITAGLAAVGALARWDSAPPRVALLPLAVLLTMVALGRTTTFGRLIGAAPQHWPVAMQTFRLPVELLLWALFQVGRIPEQMTFAGRNFDALVGLTAPLVAWLVYHGRVGRTVLAAWNLAGLGLLANIVALALRSAPGPLNAGWGGVPNTVIAEVPFVWLPAFLVPLAVFGHVVSLRQLASSTRPREVSAGGV